MNEIIKYNNDLNLIPIRTFSAVESRIFFAVVAIMKEQGTKELHIPCKDIRRICRYSDKKTKKMFRKDFASLAAKAGRIQWDINSTDIEGTITLFPSFYILKDSDEAVIKVNEDLQYILNDLSHNFTLFDALAYMEITSGTYTQILYRMLMQYKTTGTMYVSKDELVRILELPEGFPAKKIREDILNPSIKELSKYFNDLTVEVKREKLRGAPVKGYLFTFEKKSQPIIEGTDNKGAANTSYFDNKTVNDAFCRYLAYKRDKWPSEKITDYETGEQIKMLGTKSEKEAVAIIENSIRNGWKGLFATPDEDNSSETTGFNAFSQRKYCYEALEEALAGNKNIKLSDVCK